MRYFLSLGLGVQSSTLLFMIHDKFINYEVDFAIFADTQWEPYWVYDYLEYIKSIIKIPIVIISRGNLRADTLKKANNSKFVDIPLHTNNGLAKRQCTTNYKIEPINYYVHKYYQLSIQDNICGQLLGISSDEITRVKVNKIKSIKNIYPLIELDYSREDCLSYLKERGYKLPKKSACIGCPYRNNTGWKEIVEDPALYQDAIEVDETIRLLKRDFNNRFYLHHRRIPIRQLKNRILGKQDINHFENECEGYCGV